MNALRKTFFLLSILIAPFVFSGCGDKQQLQGTVRFPDDMPLTVGTVCFVSDDYFSRGILRDDGSFRLGSEKKADGIPPGTYKVYVMGAIDEIEENGEGVVRLLIDPKYTRKETTPLEFTIPGEKTFNFIVEVPTKKRTETR